MTRKFTLISDLDIENRIIDINHQLQRTSSMEYIIESTKTNAGTRKIQMTEEVFRCFQAILEYWEGGSSSRECDRGTCRFPLPGRSESAASSYPEHPDIVPGPFLEYYLRDDYPLMPDEIRYGEENYIRCLKTVLFDREGAHVSRLGLDLGLRRS